MQTDPWKDPGVKSALESGRIADDIYLLDCPRCGRPGYYNQGSHFSCRFCRRTWYVLGEDEPPADGRPSMSADDMTTLADASAPDCDP